LRSNSFKFTIDNLRWYLSIFDFDFSLKKFHLTLMSKNMSTCFQIKCLIRIKLVLVNFSFHWLIKKKNSPTSYNYSSYTDHEKVNTWSRSRSRWWTVTVMDGHGHGHGDGRSRSRWWMVETVRNDLERTATKWNETKRSVTVTGRFPLKTKDSLY
jgi:hypothetical protein